MHRSGQIAVVVPAYNEARHIGRTLRTIPAFVDRVVVVDDASIDATSAAAAAVGDPRIRIVRHARNQGVGAALKTGYRIALEGGAEVVAVMAGDGQMAPEELEHLIGPVLRGHADYVKGDRLSHPAVRSRMPRLRFAGNHALSVLTRLSTGLPIHDSQCGYTAISRSALERLPLELLWSRYGYPNDLLGWLALSGCRVQEVVVAPVYGSERSGIGFRHALFVVPYVLLRVGVRRLERTLTTRLASLPAAEPE